MKHIDLAKSISESNSAFLKKLPAFLVRWIEKIICQEAMNDILERFKDCHGVEFHRKVIGEFNLEIIYEGLENLPESGKCFFVANHPFGIVDGLILTRTVLEKYGDLRAIGNDAFMLIPNLRPYIAKVNVYGMTQRESITQLESIYRSDLPITHFPAGEVSRKYHGKVQDCEWQKSFITKAVSCQRDIVPFYFHGRNSRLFYGINIVRRLLGIKLNIELMLLPRELFNKRNKTIRVTIGKPVSYQSFTSDHSALFWAQKVREHVYRLASPGAHKDLRF